MGRRLGLDWLGVREVVVGVLEDTQADVVLLDVVWLELPGVTNEGNDCALVGCAGDEGGSGAHRLQVELEVVEPLLGLGSRWHDLSATGCDQIFMAVGDELASIAT